LVDHVELVDEEGKPVDRALLYPSRSEAARDPSGESGADEASTVETTA
jgi:hypothetical protein